MAGTLMLMNPRKRKRSRRSAARRRSRKTTMHFNPRKRRSAGRRRGGRRSSGFSASGILGSVKNTFRGDSVKLGFGVVLGNVATQTIWAYFLKPVQAIDATTKLPQVDSAGKPVYAKDANGNVAMASSLPLGTQPVAPYLYLGGLPILLGSIVSKWSRALGDGMKIGGIVNLLNLTVTPILSQEVNAIQAKVTGTSAYVRGNRAYLPGNGGRNLLTNPVGNFPGQRALFPRSAFVKR